MKVDEIEAVQLGSDVAERCLGSILPPQDGFLFLNKQKFAAAFAADVEPGLAAFMADSQVPWGVEALRAK